MDTLYDDVSCLTDIFGLMKPGPSAELVSELECCVRLQEEQLKSARSLQRDEIDRDCQNRSELSRNDSLMRTQNRGTCFILGSGPSLSEVDFELLGEQNYFGLNFVHRFERCPQLAHIVVSHWDVFDLSRFTNEERVQMCDEFKSARPTEGIFVPWERHEQIVQNSLLPSDITYYVRNYPFRLHHGLDRPLNLCHALPPANNVSQKAIMIALAMGYKRIILLGMDHDFMMHTTTQAYGQSPSKKILDKEQGRAGGGYFGDGFRNRWNMWRAYTHLHYYAQDNGVEIINASVRSALDVFPRADYRDFASK